MLGTEGVLASLGIATRLLQLESTYSSSAEAAQDRFLSYAMRRRLLSRVCCDDVLASKLGERRNNGDGRPLIRYAL